MIAVDASQQARQQQVRYSTPELRLNTLIQVNPDLGYATVVVRGSLSRSNCDELIRMVARTSYLASDLSITVDLSEAKTVESQAVSRLGNYPTWMVIEPGSPVTTMMSDGSATNPLSSEVDRQKQVRTGPWTWLAPDEPFPADLTALDQTEVEVLNSRTHRQLDTEYLRDLEPNPETSARLDEVTEELDRRDAEAH
ncbi:hypothetical protein [Arthrobacter sp. HLT1-21]